MTVLLVLLFLVAVLSIDAIRQSKARKKFVVENPQDVFVHTFGGKTVFTMADGGEKVNKEKIVCICPSCGQEIKV